MGLSLITGILIGFFLRDVWQPGIRYLGRVGRRWRAVAIREDQVESIKRKRAA